MNNIQSEFNSVLANPCYDDQAEQIAEVERLKLELARKGIHTSVDTLKNGLVLPDREEPPLDGKKKYLRGDEFLMKNPFPKTKKSKAAKGMGKRKASIRKARKSPMKRTASPGSDD